MTRVRITLGTIDRIFLWVTGIFTVAIFLTYLIRPLTILLGIAILGLLVTSFFIGRQTKKPQIIRQPVQVPKPAIDEPLPQGAKRLILEFGTTSDQSIADWSALNFLSANRPATTIEGEGRDKFWHPTEFVIHKTRSVNRLTRVIIDANFLVKEGAEPVLKLMKSNAGYSTLRVYDIERAVDIGHGENRLTGNLPNAMEMPLDWR